MNEAELAKEQVAAQVKVLKLQPGDILAVKVGIENMGDGMPPWIPSFSEIEAVHDDLETILPEGVQILISHMGVNYEIIRDVVLAQTVQVEKIPDE